MVRVLPKKSGFQKFKNAVISPSSRPYVLVLFLLIALPVIVFLLQRQQEIRQHAATSLTAKISVEPSSQSVGPGQSFTVDVIIDSGGQPFNSAEADVTVNNFVVTGLDITPPSSNGCNFVFVNQQRTPTVSSPSFSGGIKNTFSSNCTLYTLTLTAPQSGTGSITITNGSVRSFSDGSEIFLSSVDGTYDVIPPTPTPTPTPTPFSAPQFDHMPSSTFNRNWTLSGTKPLEAVDIFVNGSNANVTYPTSTTWQVPEGLSSGVNTFSVYGQDAQGNKGITNTIQIILQKLADINGDGLIDLTDLSIFGSDYKNTGTLNNPLSDIDGNGTVDLGDFSILIRNYGL